MKSILQLLNKRLFLQLVNKERGRKVRRIVWKLLYVMHCLCNGEPLKADVNGTIVGYDCSF